MRNPILAGSPGSLGLPRRAPSPVTTAPPRRVPVAWQDSAWRLPVTVPVRASRLKPHDTSFTHRAAHLTFHASRFTSHVSRNQKHLLRRIIL